MFEETTRTILGLFGEPSWQAHGIATVPAGVTVTDPNSTNVQISVLMPSIGVNRLSIDGQVIADVYTPRGQGPLLSVEILDKLSQLLRDRLISVRPGVSIQLFTPYVRQLGTDRSNNLLSKSQLLLNFKRMEVV